VRPRPVGIYLPIELEVPIFMGGVLSWLVQRTFARRRRRRGTRGGRDRTAQPQGHAVRGRLITGEALVGVGVAIIIVISGSAEPIALPQAFQFGGCSGSCCCWV